MSNIPKPVWFACRGIPPGSRSRSITVTEPAPRRRSSIAAASPAGPPPTTTTPSAIDLAEHCPDRRLAEEPLAASHQDTRAAPQPVDVDRGDRAPDRRLELPPGDPLAEAHDAAEVRVLRYQLGALERTRRDLADVGHPRLRPGRLRRQLQAGGGEPLPHPLGDRHRRRHPGGADPARARVALVFVHAKLIIAVLGRRAKARERRRNLMLGQRRDNASAVGEQRLEPRRSRRTVVPIVEVLGGRPQEHVSVHRGGNEHTLCTLGRDREQDVGDERAGELVEDDQLPAARPDGELPTVPQQRVDLVTVKSRGVDEVPRANRAPRRPKLEPVTALDRFDRCVEGERAPALNGLGGQRQRRGPRTQDSLVGDLERAVGAGAERRLAPVQLVDVDPAGSAVSVLARGGLDRGQRVQLLRRPRDHQAPIRAVGMPASAAYSRSNSYPRVTSRASMVPGLASNPVCMIAVLALLVPVPTSLAASISTHETPRRVSSRAVAHPTTPAPTTATSNGSPGAGPCREISKSTIDTTRRAA